MMEEKKKYKIVYVTPALYMAGGVERVLTLKANYFAEQFGYDITIVLTEGKDKPYFYPLSSKVKVINFDLHFEELWTCSFLKKILVYLPKQRRFKKLLTKELMRIRPDFTISLLRREINFITNIKDGSRKIGELHINRDNYRNFKTEKSNLFKNLFSKIWSYSLLQKLKRLDKLVVLTEKDRESWVELDNVIAIPDPLSFTPSAISDQSHKRVLAIARYSHEKGIDLLLKAWSKVEKDCEEWRIDVYGDGNKEPYERLMVALGIDQSRCALHGRTVDVEKEYVNSSIFVLSSRFEGFGMAIIEAMACGLPVVAFDCPWGPRSIIKDRINGLLVENGNTTSLANKLSVLMENDSLRMLMARTSLNTAKGYKIDTIANYWNGLFTEIISSSVS